MRRTLTLLLAFALVTAVAGCSSEPPPTPVNDMAVEDEPAPPAEPATPPPPVAEPPRVEPPAEVNDVAVEEPIDESAQTQEDADAVGLTTRALPNAEDEQAAPAGNDGEPEAGE